MDVEVRAMLATDKKKYKEKVSEPTDT